MDRQIAEAIVAREIEKSMTDMFPDGAGTVAHPRVKYHLDHVALAAFAAGGSYALTSLMTVEEVAVHLGVSTRRVRAIAGVQHERFGIGWQVPGTNQWLFRPEELDSLRPGLPGRPRKSE